MIQLTNTLTGKREAFTPLVPGKVSLYVCGPTVYGLTHVGNARPVVFFDVVRRYLESEGFQVTFVSNFTDVDDKIINRARQENSTSEEIAERFTAEFLKDVAALKTRRPDLAPKVTETMPEIIQCIEGLVKNGAAYVAADGEVFYSVRGFPGYGKLSGKNIDDLISGARVEPDEKKRDPLDFSLWKPRKKPDEPAWDSPWGKGRPGWHIECSAMALKHLGETLDIHGGGLDLIHPHHENEIAQSEALTAKPLARYWMHVNLVSINNEKMSKSLGNIFLNRDFTAKYTGEVLKYLLLSNHYRSPIDFSPKHISDCQAALHRIYTTSAKCEVLGQGTFPPATAPSSEEKNLQLTGDTFSARWHEAMNDDFNTAKIVGMLFDYVRLINGYVDKKGFKPTITSRAIAEKFNKNRRELAGILNLFNEDPAEYLASLKATVIRDRGLDPVEIDKLVAARIQARTQKDFAQADSLRAQLTLLGVELQDSAQGTEWDITF